MISKLLSANPFTCKGTYMTVWVGRIDARRIDESVCVWMNAAQFKVVSRNIYLQYIYQVYMKVCRLWVRGRDGIRNHIAFVHSAHCTFAHAAQFKDASRADTTHKCMDTHYVYHIAHLCMEYVILNASVCVCIIHACGAIQSCVSPSLDTQVNRHTCTTIRVASLD